MGVIAVPGQPIVLSAGEYNAAVEAGQWYRQFARYGQGGRVQSPPIVATSVWVQNDTGADLDAGAVVELSGSPLTDPGNQYPWFSGIVRAGDDPVCAVLYDPIPDGDLGLAVVSGVVFANVDIQDADNTHARISPSATQFTGDFGGYARILYKPSGTGVKWCAVLLGNCEQIVRKARSSGTITAGSSGTANVYINGASRGSVTAYLDWMDGGGNIASGTDLYIQYFHDEDRWQVVGAECSA